MPTATKSGTPTVTQNATNYLWATQVLGDLGGPSFQTKTNIDNFVRWMTFEEPASTWDRNNNPLNVETNGQSAVTSTYPTLNAAAAGTASVIGQTNMQSIYNALATSAPWPQFAQAVNSSPWGTSISINSNQSLPPNISATGKNLGGGGSAATTGKALAGTCGSGSQGISLPLVGGHFFDACQTKALVGGLAVGLGGIIMLVGVVVVVRIGLSGTAAGKAAGTVAQAATKNPVVKAAANLTPQARADRRMVSNFQTDTAARRARNARYRKEQRYTAFSDENGTQPARNPNRAA